MPACNGRNDSQTRSVDPEHVPAGRTLAVGDRIPDVTVQLLEEGKAKAVRTGALFANRRVVAFALPGAFTPTCSAQHLPRYEDLAPAFRAAGVDALYCFSVNDPFVLAEWGRAQGVREVQLVADGNGDFAQAMGQLEDRRELGFGRRSHRYSLHAVDGRIEQLYVEAHEAGDPFRVSDAETMLAHLAPQAPRPAQIAIVTKPGCPWCTQAKDALRAHGLAYAELALDDAQRGRVLAALANATTAPQIFVGGRLLGGTEQLQEWLERQPGPSASPR